MKFIINSFLIIILMGLGACQMKPTKVTSQAEALIKEKSIDSDELISSGVIVLDTRSPFDYNLSHIPGSLNVQWQDFSSADKAQIGKLDPDSFAIARRFALMGVDPYTEVVVVGKALEGSGEEGRIAWMLNFLGVQKVKTLAFNLFKFQMIQAKEERPPKNKPIWKPILHENLNIEFHEFNDYLTQDNRLQQKVTWPTKARSSALQGAGILNYPSNIKMNIVLDVREESEVKQRPFLLHQKERVLNISWKNFFNSDGTVNKAIVEILKKQNITSDTNIVVVSDQGKRSAAVTYALLTFNFAKTRNFSPGLNYFFSRQK